MSTFSFVISWLSASRIEALLARHSQVEETDLLLGLLAQGGAVAQLLGRQGVSLEAARRSAQEVEDADLRQIGITLVEGVRPRRLEADGETFYHGAELELSPAARQVCTERLGRVRSSAQALTVLLRNDDAPSARLLRGHAADLAVLRAELESLGEKEQSALLRVQVPHCYAEEGLERAWQVTRYLSASMSQVRHELVSTTGLHRELIQDMEVLDTSPTRLVAEARGRRGRPVRFAHEVSMGQEGAIVWRSRVLSGRWAGTTHMVRDYGLEEADGGVVVRYTCLTRSFGFLGRAVAPLSALLTGTGMSHPLIVLAARLADQA